MAIKMGKKGVNEEDLIEEAKIMKNFRHENLVKLCGVCTSQGPVFILMELVSQGCLLEFIRRHRELAKKNEVILHMVLQICSAMQCLESNGYIHRDLAARNCLIGEDNVVKVGGFHLTRFVLDDEYIASEEETKPPIKWASPEVLTHAKFSSKSDVWAFGILMWELWSGGRTPYPTFTIPQLLDKVPTGYRLEKPRPCKPEVYDIMQECWSAQAEERPAFKIIFSKLRGKIEYDCDYSTLRK